MPRTALVLGLAGLVPFVYGAAATIRPGLTLGELYGPNVLDLYGVAIFCFMSGVFWGFAARAEGGSATRGYVASVVPVLGMIGLIFAGITTITEALFLGFGALLAFDWGFRRAGLAPDWWLRLRVPLTAVVLICIGTALTVRGPA